MNKKKEKSLEERTETHHASPNMKKFFNRLADLKRKIKEEYEETEDGFLGEVYEEFNKIYKPNYIDFEEANDDKV
jgi:hypothetical protein